MQAAAPPRSIIFEGGWPMAAVMNGSEVVGEFDESSHGEAEGKQTSADPSVVLGILSAGRTRLVPELEVALIALIV